MGSVSPRLIFTFGYLSIFPDYYTTRIINVANAANNHHSAFHAEPLDNRDHPQIALDKSYFGNYLFVIEMLSL